ncbi:MAG: hypothetical protein WBM50_14110 [Acidimicrobiales bacterium]
MAQARNQFVQALSAHDQRNLREAFDRVNDATEQKLHRTTLTRWLDGSVPNREDFIRLLAGELDDPKVYEAWESARETRSPAGYRSVVTRFDGLSPEDRELAYTEIRRSYLASRFPKLLDRLSYRVEINDPPEPDTDYLVVRVTQEYDSDLPANVRVIFTTTPKDLGDAYEDSRCLFRDIVPMDQDRLDALLEAGPSPVLAYNLLAGSSQRMITHHGVWRGGGLFEFDNDPVADARVRLSFEYPFPRGRQIWPIRFGEFRVAGGAEFTLTLNARSATAPDVFAYPPAGRHREWAADQVRPDELVVSLGAGGTVLADGDGLVLSWAENE